MQSWRTYMNKNKTVNLFVSNLTNVIVHKVLERAIDKPEIVSVYVKEAKNSLEIAKKYREKINPLDKALPTESSKGIKDSLITKVTSELNARIRRGYTNIDLSLVEIFVDDYLRELGVTK